jgi:hypothetical protein
MNRSPQTLYNKLNHLRRLLAERGGAGKRSQWDRKEKEYALGGKPQTET